jgi:hypothetical protein
LQDPNRWTHNWAPNLRTATGGPLNGNHLWDPNYGQTMGLPRGTALEGPSLLYPPGGTHLLDQHWGTHLGETPWGTLARRPHLREDTSVIPLGDHPWGTSP